MKLIVSKIESFATLDGDGIRMAVFLQGCLLRCSYCHNPETWRIYKKPESTMCGAKVMTTQEILKMAVKNKPYFANGGGVTFSGGEPMVQAKALAGLLIELKKNDINVVIDTSGVFGESRYFRKVLKYTDEVLLDLKFANQEDYCKYTGGNFDEVLEFLDYLEAIRKPTVVKSVIVPGINDSEEYIKKYIDIIKKYECVEKYELLGFHTMGFNKYKELNIINRLENTRAFDAKKLKKLQEFMDKELKRERAEAVKTRRNENGK